MAEEVVGAVYENVFDPFTEGLGLASSDPKRFLFFAGASALTMWYLKPESMFAPDGSQRPFKAVSDSRGATAVPWYIVSALVGTAAVLFL
jgi:hypothetical protein